MIKKNLPVLAYLILAATANIVTTRGFELIGPYIMPIVAFIFIGVDITLRDKIHERWARKGLWWKMGFLICGGSLLSWVTYPEAGQVALASALAFCGAGIVDTFIYHIVRKKSRRAAIHTSNVGSAAIDSLIFPFVAFGILALPIIAMQFAAKVAGGSIFEVVWHRVTKDSSK